MDLKRVRGSLAAKHKRARHAAASPLRLLLAAPKRRFILMRDNKWLLATHAFFITVAVLLLACTSIDILRQSFSSGQFWNSIIVVSSYAIVLVWTLTLNLVRQVDVNRWLVAIPRRHQVNRSDLGGKMMRRIIAVREKCLARFRTQIDFSLVEHDGLQNPLRHLKTNYSEGAIETPYWEFADTVPMYIEDTFTLVAPDFTIPLGCSLRDYIALAITEKLLDPTNIEGHISRFLDLYEQLRYSGVAQSHANLREMMEAISTMLNRVQQVELATYHSPRYAASYAASDAIITLNSGVSSAYTVAPSDAYNEQPVPLNIFSRHLRNNSSRSSLTTLDSVRIYPSRRSVESTASSVDSRLSFASRLSRQSYNSHASAISPLHHS